MQDHPVLGQVALGYCPVIDRHRNVTAARLSVFPLRPDVLPDAADLVACLAEVFPLDGGEVCINAAGEGLLQGLLGAAPPANMMIEVPAFMAADPANAAALQAVHAAGSTLLVKGRPVVALPRDVLPCFKHSIIDYDDDRRTSAAAPAGQERRITHMQSGVRTLAEMEDSFKRGASAVLGWPTEDVPVKSGAGKQAPPALQVIVDLIKKVDQQQPIDKLEAVLTNDPTLAFRLLRYINSPAFGLRVEISSFRHAIMMLGYQKLKRWLALLLATASKDTNMKPVMFAAVRRGLFMEQLVRGSGDDDLRSEMFLCGVFSLLDRLMGQPFAEMLKTIPVPERVFQALVHDSGPFRPYIDVVRAVEQESLYDIRDAADALMISVAEVNRALLRALVAARQVS